MKSSRKLWLGALLLAATGAFAADSGSLRIFDSAHVAGKELKPGSYKVEWQGNGPNVQVNILKGKSVVASTQGRLVDRERPASQNATVTRKNADGTTSVSEVQFEGKRYSLDLSGETQNASNTDAK